MLGDPLFWIFVLHWRAHGEDFCTRWPVFTSEVKMLPWRSTAILAIMDANNGVEQYLGGAAMMPSMLWANVYDSDGGLGEKWGIDETRLVQKMQHMSKATLIAIQEVCDRFWSPTDERQAHHFRCGKRVDRKTFAHSEPFRF
jgi:hypothetical protein